MKDPIYSFAPIIYVDTLAERLKEIYGREFELRTTIMEPPGNDCYIKFRFDDPLRAKEIENDVDWYGKKFIEDYKAACTYLKSQNIPGDYVIVDTSW